MNFHIDTLGPEIYEVPRRSRNRDSLDPRCTRLGPTIQGSEKQYDVTFQVTLQVVIQNQSELIMEYINKIDFKNS